jgi:hypothetical protein
LKFNALAASLIWIAFALGCSATGSNPVQSIDKPDNAAKPTSVDTGHQLWGMWDICIDLEALTATAMPDRDIEKHFSVLSFLSPPNCNDCLKMHVISYDPITSMLDIDVTLSNKLPLYGYDVRGIVFTDDLGHLLNNEDAWTALYDIPGGNTINPFKAYAKYNPDRNFPGNSAFTEKFRIEVPDPPKFVMIKYAVDASYPSNCQEPYALENFTQTDIMAVPGSHGNVRIDVKDWQNDIDSVTIYAPELNDEPLSLTHQFGNTWSSEFTNLKASTAGKYIGIVTATSTGSGTTALYYSAGIQVGGWARNWSIGQGRGAVVDGSNNVYVTGYYAGPADFDPGTKLDIHSSYGFTDIFLSKFDSSGNLQWARTWGGIGQDYVTGIMVDEAGNVYVTGHFQGTVDFDPGSAIDNHTSNGESVDIFLSKFDSNGNYQWNRTWGGDNYDYGNDLILDGSGNLFVTGRYFGPVDFDPGSGIDVHDGEGAFLSKFDSSGNYQWARTWGGSNYDTGNGVGVDASGNAYVLGEFYGTVDFDPGITVDYHDAGWASSDIFLTKYDSSGNYQWTRTWGGIGGASYGKDIAVDSNGNSYATGYISGSGAFLKVYDSGGNGKWMRTWGVDGYNGADGYGVALDESGNAIVTGYFWGTVDFDPGTGVDNRTTISLSDIFLSKFDSSGKYLWARTWGGTGEQNYGFAVGIDQAGNSYLTGYFEGTVDFDPGTGVDNHTAKKGNQSIFLCKLDPYGNW